MRLLFKNALTCLLVAASLLALAAGTASAKPEVPLEVTYTSGKIAMGKNYYKITLRGAVTREGEYYTINGSLHGYCIWNAGPAQKMKVSYGSSVENWRYSDEWPCEGERRVSFKGPIGNGEISIAEGAYGGMDLGSWGWKKVKIYV